MKKSILFIAIMALMVAISAQTPINQLNSKGKKEGVWKKYDDKGNLVYVGQFKNDVPVGEFTYYHTNGKIKSKTLFIEGPHIVRTTIFDQQGNKSAEGKFVDQDKDSIWNYYNSKGTLIHTESYKLGVKEGVWRTYSAQTGILLQECSYKNGQLHGKYTTYFTDGKVSTRIDYMDGKMHGVCESYYPEEKIYTKGYYTQGQKNHNWDTYDEKGRIRKTVEYKNSRIVKTYIYFYVGSNGQKINQDLIAYFHKEGNGTRLYTRNGKTMLSTDSFEVAVAYLEFVDFCLINPSYAVSYNSIIRYRKIDSDSIEVTLSPATEEPVICQGDNAKTVMMLFNNEIPKEE